MKYYRDILIGGVDYEVTCTFIGVVCDDVIIERHGRPLYDLPDSLYEEARDKMIEILIQEKEDVY